MTDIEYHAHMWSLRIGTGLAWMTILFGFGVFQNYMRGCGEAKGADSSAWLLGAVVGFVVGSGGIAWVKYLTHARRALANRFAQQTRSVECGTFILYLRSFRDDEYEPPDELVSHTMFGMGALTQTTDEQRLVAEIQADRSAPAHFEMLAVGHPDEELPPLGCTRYSFPNETWKEEVEKLMKRASVVLLRPGVTPAVIWETENLLRFLPYERVYVLARSSGYDEWREQTQLFFPHPLPVDGGSADILGFADGWVPMVAPPTASSDVSWMLQRAMRVWSDDPPSVMRPSMLIRIFCGLSALIAGLAAWAGFGISADGDSRLLSLCSHAAALLLAASAWGLWHTKRWAIVFFLAGLLLIAVMLAISEGTWPLVVPLVILAVAACRLLPNSERDPDGQSAGGDQRK